MKLLNDAMRQCGVNRCDTCGAAKVTKGCLACLLRIIGPVKSECDDNRPDSMYIHDMALRCAVVRAERWNASTQKASKVHGEDKMRPTIGGKVVESPRHRQLKRNDAWDEMHDQPYWQDDLRYNNV